MYALSVEEQFQYCEEGERDIIEAHPPINFEMKDQLETSWQLSSSHLSRLGFLIKDVTFADFVIVKNDPLPNENILFLS